MSKQSKSELRPARSWSDALLFINEQQKEIDFLNRVVGELREVRRKKCRQKLK